MGIDSIVLVNAVQFALIKTTGTEALQFTLVKPSGEIVKVNSFQNKDLFWALRGGGGSTWGCKSEPILI
jgi:hypothetical protein